MNKKKDSKIASKAKPARPDDDRLKEYEELLIKREQFFKESKSYEVAYAKEFGELVADILQAKIECIRLKKTIAFCQSKINKGETIDSDAMKKTIEEEMMGYYAELNSLRWKNKQAKESTGCDEYTYTMVKKIYRRIAKMLHPDINAKTAENQDLMDLWEDTRAAYLANNLDKLEDLEVLINRKMKELGEDGFELSITEIEKRIERLEKQIADILSTKPYTYGEILSEPEERRKHKEVLEKELEEYKTYAKSLEEALETLISEGGGTFTWQMN